MTTSKLAPEVKKNIKRMFDCGGKCYAEMMTENATLQREWERERVRKALKKSIQYDLEFGEWLINKRLFEAEIGIEQEEKEK